MKLTPKISKDMHKDIRKGFVQYAKVFPMCQTMGFKVPAKWYRRIVGWLEVGCGFILIFVPGFMKQFANVLLLLMMLGAVYTHYAIDDKFERTAPAIVFTFMLTCRLVVYLQVRRKESMATTKALAKATLDPLAKEFKQD